MQIQYHSRDLSAASREKIIQFVQGWAKKHLEPMLSGYGYAESRLQIDVVKHSKGGGRYTAKLRLHAPPKKMILAHAVNSDVLVSLTEACNRLIREVQKHVGHIRKSIELKKNRRSTASSLEREAQLSTEETITSPALDLEAMWPSLRKTVNRELDYLGLATDWYRALPTPDELLSEIFSIALERQKKTEGTSLTYADLLGLMHQVLQREIQEQYPVYEELSVEGAPEADAEDQAKRMTEEDYYEFHSPDQSLRLEDYLMDEFSETEEEYVEVRQEIGYLVDFLKELPIIWRRVFFLKKLDLLTDDELAKLFDVNKSEIQHWLTCAQDYLRSRLSDIGLSDRSLTHLGSGGH